MESAKTRTLGPRLAVGFGLGAVLLLSLLHPLAFTLLVAVASGFAAAELSVAMRSAGWHVPRLVALLAPGIVISTYFLSAEGQWLGLLISISLLVVWRIATLIYTSNKQSFKQTLRDFGGTAFVLVYVPLLLSFSIELVLEPFGVQWVLGLVLTVAIIDTFGYLIGRFFGKTKLSPEISPKKTWEGLAASIFGAFVGGQVLVLITPASFLFGLVFGAAILLSSVLGDLSESLIKRDLNVKDMGKVLPGHGGVLDRIDSLIPSSFVAYLMSQLVF